MNAPRAVVVETLLGPLGLVLGARGLQRVLLPDATDRDRARASVLASLAALRLEPGAPDEVAAAWGARFSTHLRGERVAYDDLPLDHGSLTPFTRAVYDETRRIPPGETRTYAALCQSLGRGSARAIGVAMARNPTPIVVPCHRVIAVGGAGGFSAPGGLATKAALLSLEGGSLDDAEHAMARRHVARVDPALAPLIRSRACDLPVRSRGGLFRTLVRAITGQQLSGKAAATIFGRLEARLGAPADPGDHAGRGVPSWSSDDVAVWRDAAERLIALSDEALREIGLSSAKARAVRGLAEAVRDGTLDLASLERAPDEHVVAELVKLRGIGRWTVEMLLIFELGRPDVLPVDDLGIRKGAQRVFRLRELPDAEQLTEIAEKWRPFRSIGSWYLWRSLEAAPE
jgi:methylated-DNA-[protein]-cysteine S-methyltransferase